MKHIKEILLEKRPLVLPSILMVGVLFATPIKPLSAQESVDLNSYLNQISESEPSQENLQTGSQEEPEGVFGGVFSQISDALPGGEDGGRQVNDGDALPNIPNVNARSTQAGMNLPVSNDPLSADSLGLIEKTPQQLEEEIRREAFDAAITGLFPLSVDNVKETAELLASMKPKNKDEAA